MNRRLSRSLALGALLAFESLALSAASTLVARGSAWRYLDDGSDQGSAWRAPGFTDGAWSSGAAQLGYGDGDEATVVGFGPSATAKYVTTYFRRAFAVADPAAITRLDLSLVRDDGAVVYLNGDEIWRGNMPTGVVTYTTLALAALSDETTFHQTNLSPALLRAGTNVLAVEIHQVNGQSSDVSFDLLLHGQSSGAETLVAARRTRGGGVELSWPVTAGSLVLQYTDSLVPPITWQPEGRPMVTNGPLKSVAIDLTSGARYYSLGAP